MLRPRGLPWYTMAWNRKISALLLLVAVAVAGYLLRSFVPNVLSEYEQAASFHPVWGYVYLGVVGVSGAAFLILILWAVWALLSNTRSKDRRRATANLAIPARCRAASSRPRSTRNWPPGRRWPTTARLPADVREPIRRSLDCAGKQARANRRSRSSPSAPSPAASPACSTRWPVATCFAPKSRGGTTVTRNEIPWPGADRSACWSTRPAWPRSTASEREELAKRAARDADLVLFVTDGPLKDFEYSLPRTPGRDGKTRPGVPEQGGLVQARRSRAAARSDRRAGGAASCRAKTWWRCAPSRPLAFARACWPTDRKREEAVAGRARHSGPGRSDAGDRGPRRPRPAAGQFAAAIARPGGRGQGASANRAGQAGPRDRRPLDVAGRRRRGLSPLPVVDLAAGMGITSNMVLQLARVYRQKIDLDTVGRLLGELGQAVAVAWPGPTWPLRPPPRPSPRCSRPFPAWARSPAACCRESCRCW